MIAWLEWIFQDSLAFNPSHHFSPSCGLLMEPEHLLSPNLGFFLWRHHPAASSTLQGFLGFPQARTWARKAKIYYLLNMPWLPAPGSVLQASWPHFLGAHIPGLVTARPPPRSQVLAPLTLPCWQTSLQAPPPSPALLKPLGLPETSCLLSCPRSRALRFLNCSGCSFLNSLQLSSINCR